MIARVKRRRTKNRRAVAEVLLAGLDARHWGFGVAKRAGLNGAQVFQVLKAMLEDGWLADEWEDPSTVGGGRSPRRYYRVTNLGRDRLPEVVGACSACHPATAGATGERGDCSAGTHRANVLRVSRNTEGVPMRETFTASVTTKDIVITLERRTDSGQLTASEPVNVIPLPAEKFGITWLNNAIQAKGFHVDSAWAFETTDDGLHMGAVLSEIQ